MLRRKRTLLVLFTLIFALLLAACQSDEPEAVEPTEAPAEVEEAEEPAEEGEAAEGEAIVIGASLPL